MSATGCCHSLLPRVFAGGRVWSFAIRTIPVITSPKYPVGATARELGENTLLVSGNARPKRMYFVVFYGSTADFAWVSDTAIINYQGVEAFTKYAQESVDKVSVSVSTRTVSTRCDFV